MIYQFSTPRPLAAPVQNFSAWQIALLLHESGPRRVAELQRVERDSVVS
jgi:hypothetical protein